MKESRLFTLLIVIALIAVGTLTAREAIATTAVVQAVDSADRLHANDEGLAIYHQSERSTEQVMSVASNEKGLAIYHESEHNSGQFAATVSNDEGLALYHDSERQASAMTSLRLFNGKYFNAYQRSEWLGADR